MKYNKLYNEDCLKTMARMPNDFIDLTVTSPPYDNLRTYNGYCFDFENVAKELYRVTKKGGVVVWVVGDKTNKGSESGTSFKQALYFIECGFNLHDTMIYKKNNPIPNANTRYNQSFEYMFVFSKGKPKAINLLRQPYKETTKERNKYAMKSGFRQPNGEFKDRYSQPNIGDRVMDNVFYYTVGTGNSTKDKIAFKHPAIFPEQLATDHIVSWSNENDIVYDPFAGSGTTCKMADINNRKWLASEISNEYCEIILKRVYPNGFEKTTVRGFFSFTDDTQKDD